ncbi:MAG: MFS transporter [Gemmataceae bacterium]
MTQWLVVTLASIGFAFDIYELLMLPLIVGPALEEIAGVARGSDEFTRWVGLLFYVPALLGGIFGLLGGYLTDLLGRRRVLTWSILIYAFSAFFAGYSTSPEMLLVLRCTTFVGVCIEFVAAVAWLAELFPDPHQRERVLGYTQAFSSIGGLLVAVMFGLINNIHDSLPAIQLPGFLSGLGTIANEHATWRYTLMSGLIPALPLIIIRPFLPESPVWQEKKDAGTLRRPSLGELFAPELRRTTIVTTIMFACSYGAAFGAIQHLPRIVPALPEVKEEIGAELKKAEQPLNEKEKKKIAGGIVNSTASNVTKVQEVGGLIGRFLLALLVVRIVSRRMLLRVFQVPGLILTPLVFFFVATQNLNLLYIGIFFVGLCTVAQFSFWGNYLPRVYPLHLRGTGESFAANIGGRMIGTSFAWVTVTLQRSLSGPPEIQLATAAALVGAFVYVVGFVASFFLPEPAAEELPD